MGEQPEIGLALVEDRRKLYLRLTQMAIKRKNLFLERVGREVRDRCAFSSPRRITIAGLPSASHLCTTRTEGNMNNG